MRHASIIGNGTRSRRVPSLLQVCSCLSACLLLPVQACLGLLLPAPARSYPPAPHEVGVCHRLWPVSFSNFVCLFGFARLLVSAPSRLQACSCPLYMKSVFVTGYALCLFATSCDFSRPCPSAPCVIPHPHPQAHSPTQIQCGGRFPDPRSTRYTDPTSQHAGHATRNFGAFQCHLAQSHVVQGLDALPPRVDVGLIEVTRGYRIGVEQRE